MRRLVIGMNLNTKDVEVDGMAVVEIVNQLRAKVI